MKSIYLYLFIAILLLSGCATTKNVDATQIKTVVESQNFSIESNMAQPMATIGMSQLQNSGLLGPENSASNISLIGNSNFLKINGDSIMSHLPYFGERRSSAGYGGDNAIEFEGELSDYNAVWDDKKQRYIITFSAKSNSEQFDVRMLLYPSLKSYVTLTSSTRTSITYIGKVNQIKNEDV